MIDSTNIEALLNTFLRAKLDHDIIVPNHKCSTSSPSVCRNDIYVTHINWDINFLLIKGNNPGKAKVS